MRFLKRWILGEREERLQKLLQEQFGKMEVSLKENCRFLQKRLAALEELIKKANLQLLENLKEKESSQKKLSILLDWENLYFKMKEKKLEFPGKRLIEEATLVFEKASIFNFAFCEGYLHPQTRNLLEISGFTVVWSRKADEAILSLIQNLLISHPLIEKILLFTHDKKLIAKVGILLSQVPKKELLAIELKENILKDKDGKYQVKLYSRAEKIPELFDEDRFVKIAKNIKEKRLFEPERDVKEKFFLLCVYFLTKIPQEGFRRGFENLVDVLFNTYLYPNPKIAKDPYLLEITTKQNVKLVLEALLDQTDFLKKKVQDRNYYLVNLNSKFYQQIYPYFEKIKKYL